MMYMRLETELDVSGAEHQERDEEEAAALRALAGVLDQDLMALPGREAQARRAMICSCGHFTCPLRVRYGLPVPTFTGEIEPIRGQPARDKRALAIRAEMGMS